MDLIKSENCNPNYVAKIVYIKDFIKHPNPKCTRLKMCKVGGYHIAVGADSEPGYYVYFPEGVILNSRYLRSNNLYRESNLNKDQACKGFFEAAGRVKPIKLQGFPSEGLIMDVSSLNHMFQEDSTIIWAPDQEFDYIGDSWICKKYEVPTQDTRIAYTKNKLVQKRQPELLIEDQFRFHVNTTLLKKCPFVIQPDSLIQITAKVHGTSAISSHVQVRKYIPKHQKAAAWTWDKLYNPLINLFSNVNYSFELVGNRYDNMIWSSRKVVKNPDLNPSLGEGYYGGADDELRRKIHIEIMKDKLTKGMTIYYEILGYLPNGACIQKNYDYGYKPPIAGETYKLGSHFGVQVYRITYTNPDGVVFEFSGRQVQQWCDRNDIQAVEQYYYGYARDLYPDLSVSEHWNDNFMDRLVADPNFFMEMNSPTCTNTVPHEGIVIRKESLDIEVYKLKCNLFNEQESKQLDSGELDLESGS